METIFSKAIGNHPKIKVLEFLIEGRELDYSVSDIAEGAGIGRTTLFRIWNDFVELGIVKPTRVIGNAKLYKLNLENAFARKMAELFDTLVIEPLNKRKKVVVKN
ncbi:winged helix-turn-helix transcriptional regulator [Candidatus Woesearchaeota archaeon]|nr:winged helix-turn-helix transcriptional regulator [Candidatus Woesearchaeota archaeon]